MFYAQLKFLSVKADSICSEWISHSLFKSKGCNLSPAFTDVTLNIDGDMNKYVQGFFVAKCSEKKGST